MNPIYKFELSKDGVNFHRVYPVYKDDLNLDYSLQQNEEFYRAKLSGKLTFQSVDYTFINTAAFDTQFDLHLYISYNAGQTWTLYWTGRFWKTDCDIDEDDRTIVVQPEAYDEYNDVLAGMEKEYNLIELAPEINHILIDKRPMIQIYLPGDSVIGCFLSGMYWEQDCEAVSDEESLKNDYYFALTASKRAVVITNANIENANGVYSANVPEDITYEYEYTFQNRHGYKFKYEIGSREGHTFFNFQVRDNENNLLWNTDYNSISPTGTGTFTLQPYAGTPAIGEITAVIEDRHIYARYICDVNSVGEQNTYPIPYDDMVADHRNYKRVVGWSFPDSILLYGGFSATPTKYGLYQPGKYYIAPPPNPYAPNEYFPVARSLWTEISVWFTFPMIDPVVEAQARKEYTLKDAYPLSSAISVLLSQIAPGITHEATTEYSQFLYGTNPISGTNYRLFLTQKSNILAGQYDQPAQKAPVTLKQITDMLRDCFRCYWFIEDGKFKIEHIQYFRKGGTYSGNPVVGIDLTQQQVVRNGKKWAFATSKYSFDKPNMPERYQFGWMDDVTQPFEGNPIEVISKYVKAGNIEEINISNFTSDVDYMLLNPGSCSEDGFALLAPVLTNGTYKLPYVDFGNRLLQNGFLAFDYLQQYYMYDLPAKHISIGGTQLTAYGISKLKNQTIKFPVYTEPVMTKLIQTNLGNGTIQKISINLSSRNANATLKYDTE